VGAEARAGERAAAPEVEVIEADAVARALERAFHVPASDPIDLVGLEADDEDHDTHADADADPTVDADASGVVYLPPPTAPTPMPGGSKWSAYTLERPRPPRPGAEHLANQR
jgi:hypothetical protein